MDGVFNELRAQVFLAIDEPLHACFEAEKCVALNSNWVAGHHTLARARRETGEVELSLASYRTAYELSCKGMMHSINDTDQFNEIKEELAEIEQLAQQLRAQQLQYEQSLTGIYTLVRLIG